MVPIIEDSHRHGDRDVTQQTEFGQGPIRAISGDRAFGVDLRLFGVEQSSQKVVRRHRLQVGALEAVVQKGSGLFPPGLQLPQVIGGASRGLLGDDDGVPRFGSCG